MWQTTYVKTTIDLHIVRKPQAILLFNHMIPKFRQKCHFWKKEIVNPHPLFASNKFIKICSALFQ